MVLPLHLAKNTVHAALDMPEFLFEDEGGEKVTLIIPYFIRFVKLNFGILSSLPVNARKPACYGIPLGQTRNKPRLPVETMPKTRRSASESESDGRAVHPPQ